MDVEQLEPVFVEEVDNAPAEEAQHKFAERAAAQRQANPPAFAAAGSAFDAEQDQLRAGDDVDEDEAGPYAVVKTGAQYG